ncbi:beta-propeller fold lactonase family protein [Erythrobacter arachoides]|uniref:Beta-propeller fold lactonase family protein n=1 Tax=Aurantiacibacter arachoides TaxID=1850444 RepID=A0A845A1K9_9SPHN|nr:YncE family protein [Aurantiacibacter arachoides]MXO93450.1 beta-propeller fold lactonase family protein [Aurantiacibacter arachoides]GGD49290.1 hypothetical protein GCM10011411_06320 [Aurantiacibacter arachoides]
MRSAIIVVAAAMLAGCATAPSTDWHEGGTIFVANKRGASLSRIDLATGAETHRATTCENPHELTVSPEKQFVMVACYSGRTVEIYRTADLVRAGWQALGENARVHSALWLDGDQIVAGAEGRGSLYLISLRMTGRRMPPAVGITEIGEGGAPPGPHLLAVSSDGLTAWGTIIPRGEVVRYDLATRQETARLRVGDQIEAIALSPDGSQLWVASNADSTAFQLDPTTLEIIRAVETGTTPIRLAFHPSGRWLVSSNYGGGDLTVIDARSGEVVRRIEVSGSAEAAQVTLVFSEDGTRLYAAETASDTIAEIDFASGAVLRRIATGPGGDGLAVID